MDSWQSLAVDPGLLITRWLIRHVPSVRGARVLEIAGGSGTVTFAAAELVREASFVCTDLTVAAVTAAAARHRDTTLATMPHGMQGSASIIFLAADMHRLPFDDGVFDATLCRFGFMFTRDPASAFRESRRVLRPGGRLAFAVWGTPEENPWQAHLDEALTSFDVEDRTAQRLPGGMFALPDPAQLRHLLEDAGLSVLELARVEFLRQYRDFDEYWAWEVDVGVDRPRKLRALPPHDLSAFRARLEAALLPYREEDGYRIPGLSLAVAALRPGACR